MKSKFLYHPELGSTTTRKVLHQLHELRFARQVQYLLLLQWTAQPQEQLEQELKALDTNYCSSPPSVTTLILTGFFLFPETLLERKAMSTRSPFLPDVLKGKVAFVTGGATGIGFGICQALGKHGAKIAIMGRRAEVLETAVKDLQAEGSVQRVNSLAN